METKPVVETPQKTLKDFLHAIPGAPTDEQIEQWKAQFGEVFVSGFDEKLIFVFRPLRRSEHRELQMKLADESVGLDQLGYEELVCDKCLLWPATYDWEKAGGIASSLSEQVYQNSHFLSPQAASMLVMRL